MTETEKHSVIVVKGPKGVGKSSALVGMLANYSLCEIPAILLTQDSLKSPLSTFSYLIKVAERFNLGKNAYHILLKHICVLFDLILINEFKKVLYERSVDCLNYGLQFYLGMHALKASLLAKG